MSENAIDNETTRKPVPDTAKPKRLRKAGKKAEPVKEGRPRQEVGRYDRLHFAGVDECQQPRHAQAVQALRGFGVIDDDVDQLGVVGPRPWPESSPPGPRERTPWSACLSVGNTNVANGFHQ
jgi:hypothetical protein